MFFNSDNSLTFKVLGSGCCVPRVERSSPAYFVKYKESKFLLDCGPGSLRQLIRAREDYKDLTGVLISHFHPDHVTDFIPLIQALNYTPDFKRKDDLLVIGAPGIQAFIESLYEIYNLRPVGYETKFLELKGKFSPAKDLFIEAVEGNHTPSSLLYKMTYNSPDKEKGFVYSGDTDFDENLANFAKNIELLVLECSLPYKANKHLTPEEAGQIAQKAQPGKLLLTHFYPPCDNPDIKIQYRVKEYYMGQVLLAQDFMEIVI